MGKINVLDKHIAELIAAGEVVERPSSVIKELVENSIDAGADSITVEIQNGGTTLMRVSDNGSGIMRDDVKLAFLRNATSKVRSENDLNAIGTLGFRGEALASICAVSKLQLITKTKVEPVGTNYQINGGEEISLSDAGCPVGTTFIVRDLFYNVPARMKFLKKDVSEGNAVSAVMDKIALSHPEISFTLIKDGKQTLKTSGDGKLLSAIYSVYGRDFSNSLIPVDYELNGVKVKGYVSKPQNARPNRNMQNFFINGRFVKSRTAMAAIEEASKGTVMVGKFPACVINIDISFEAVDVNVHPSKIEVRFINERPIFDAVYHAVKTAILSGDEKKQAVFTASNKSHFANSGVNPFEMASTRFKQEKTGQESKNPFDFLDNVKVNTQKVTYKPLADTPSVKFSDSQNPLEIYKKKTTSPIQQSKFDVNINIESEINEDSNYIASKVVSESDVFIKENEAKITEVRADSFVPDIIDSKPFEVINQQRKEEAQTQKEIKPLFEVEPSPLMYIGEAFKTYIITQINNELVFIDKHAAHERIIFEKLKAEKGAGYSQLLLEPVTVVLNKTDYNNAVNNLDLFSDCGFDIDDFGNGTLLIRSAPQYLENEDIEQTVAEMAGYLEDSKRDIRTEKMEWIYHNIACRAAIKAGNTNSTEELMVIAKKVYEDKTLNYCPHGRPICIVIKKSEIEKQFGRV